MKIINELHIFILIIYFIKTAKECQIQTENCSCTNQDSFVQMECLEDQMSFEIVLYFGQLKIDQSNRLINLTIKNKFINQIKALNFSDNDYSQMIVSLRIEDCKMKELKANSFEKMTSLTELYLINDEIEIIQQDAFKGLEFNLKTVEIVSNRLKLIKATQF